MKKEFVDLDIKIEKVSGNWTYTLDGITYSSQEFADFLGISVHGITAIRTRTGKDPVAQCQAINDRRWKDFHGIDPRARIVHVDGQRFVGCKHEGEGHKGKMGRKLTGLQPRKSIDTLKIGIYDNI